MTPKVHHIIAALTCLFAFTLALPAAQADSPKKNKANATKKAAKAKKAPNYTREAKKLEKQVMRMVGMKSRKLKVEPGREGENIAAAKRAMQAKQPRAAIYLLSEAHKMLSGELEAGKVKLGRGFKLSPKVEKMGDQEASVEFVNDEVIEEDVETVEEPIEEETEY